MMHKHRTLDSFERLVQLIPKSKGFATEWVGIKPQPHYKPWETSHVPSSEGSVRNLIINWITFCLSRSARSGGLCLSHQKDRDGGESTHGLRNHDDRSSHRVAVWGLYYPYVTVATDKVTLSFFLFIYLSICIYLYLYLSLFICISFYLYLSLILPLSL